jgi:hypothetical protein
MNRQRKRAILAALTVISIAWPIVNAVVCLGVGLLEQWLLFGTRTLSLYNLPKIGYAFWAIQSLSMINAGLLYYLWRRIGREDAHR